MFRAVPGFPGYYVSIDGRVFSMKRRNTYRGPGRFMSRFLVSRPHPRERYNRVDMVDKTGKKRTVRTAQVVAWAWHGPQPDGMLVCHRDGFNTNDRPSNLYYGSPSENLLDRHWHARGNRGEPRPTIDPDTDSYSDVTDLPANVATLTYDAELGF